MRYECELVYEEKSVVMLIGVILMVRENVRDDEDELFVCVCRLNFQMRGRDESLHI